MLIRKAEPRDMEALLNIYNYEVINGIATFDISPKNITEWKQWFRKHNVDNHPLIVAEADGQIAGYACLSSYREYNAFRSSVELSIYVGADFRQRRVAVNLMERIIEEARQDERTHLIVSLITSTNQLSIHLHEKFGFTYCGALHDVAYEMDSYQDVVVYELRV